MAQQQSANRALWIAVPFAAVVVAGLLFWLSSPAVPQAPEPAPEIAAAPSPMIAAATPAPIEVPPAEPQRPKVPSREEWEEDHDPEIPTTDNCYQIMTYKWQGTHDFIALDLIRDRGTLFLEDDLACLTAEGANPAILDHVERYQDRRQFIED